MSRKAKPKTKITTYTKTTLEVPIADVLVLLRKQHKGIPVTETVTHSLTSDGERLLLTWDSTETE